MAPLHLQWIRGYRVAPVSFTWYGTNIRREDVGHGLAASPAIGHIRRNHQAIAVVTVTIPVENTIGAVTLRQQGRHRAAPAKATEQSATSPRLTIANRASVNNIIVAIGAAGVNFAEQGATRSVAEMSVSAHRSGRIMARPRLTQTDLDDQCSLFKR